MARIFFFICNPNEASRRVGLQIKQKQPYIGKTHCVSCAEHTFYAGGFHEDLKIKAVARGAKASGWRGVSEWQRFYII